MFLICVKWKKENYILVWIDMYRIKKENNNTFGNRARRVDPDPSGSKILILSGPGLTNFNQSGPGPKILDPTGSIREAKYATNKHDPPRLFRIYDNKR